MTSPDESAEFDRQLDAEALGMFGAKGREGGPNVPQAGGANGVKVRRVLQLTRDLARKPFPALRVLDLGCGEGVYAIEAALRGADVVALDARTVRMERGAAIARRMNLANLRFLQDDVRRASRATLGGFDAVYLLGLLYHLDVPDIFRVLESVAGLCDRMLIVDTLVSLEPDIGVGWRGRTWRGARFREHGDDDPAEARVARLLKSIDNTFSFRFARDDLARALREAGFTSVLECHAPLEPGRAPDRVTLVALKDEPVVLSSYPWVNGRSESEIEAALRPDGPHAVLLHRAAWAATPPARPLTQDQLATPALRLGLHGPGKDGLKKSHHDDRPGDPYYLWSGTCPGAWAVSFRTEGPPVDLSRGLVRWRARQSGTHRLRFVVEDAAGNWLVTEQFDGAAGDWREFELDLSRARWQGLDIGTVTLTDGAPGPRPAGLGRVKAFGVADLSAGGGSAECARLDWLEIHGPSPQGSGA